MIQYYLDRQRLEMQRRIFETNLVPAQCGVRHIYTCAIKYQKLATFDSPKNEFKVIEKVPVENDQSFPT